ncbi:transposase [Neoroseomonas rubea]|uniref:transposase n=1 Tax=Neoroseomonas rubea TaxID=2748666 RepID=UPI0018DFA570|nr:transposase [Roseomonas rubea]
MRVEIITGIHHRQRYTAEEKAWLVEQTMQPGMTVSAFARPNGALAARRLPWPSSTTSGDAAIGDAEGGR